MTQSVDFKNNNQLTTASLLTLTQNSNNLINDSIPVGIINIGDSCYANASLQCLIHCTHVREQFLRYWENTPVNKALQNYT